MSDVTENKVTALFGDETPCAGIPHEGVIEYLERLLDSAKAGSLQALGAVELDADGIARWAIVGHIGTYQFVGSAALLAQEISTMVRASLDQPDPYAK